MMPLASWLDCPWRFNGDPRRETVVFAARALDDLVWRKHGIKLLYCDDPWRFRDISTDEVKRAQRIDMGLGDADYPQLGTHSDPMCRHLTAGNFYALIGTKVDRPAPLYTMNVATLYGSDLTEFIGDLFTSRMYWSDHPERDCADLDATCDFAEGNLPAVALTTAWTHKGRRHQGIMTDVSRLHRMVAWLRWPYPQFATVVPKAGSEKVFGGTDIGAVIETRDGFSKETRVLYWSPEDIVSDAIAAHGIATPPN